MRLWYPKLDLHIKFMICKGGQDKEIFLKYWVDKLLRDHTERIHAMKKTTSDSLSRLYAESGNGAVLTGKLADTMRQACEEVVSKDFYWLPQVPRENAAESALCKAKCMLITRRGKDAIRNLPAMLQTLCANEARSEARKSSVASCDPKTGLPVRTSRTVPLDGERKQACNAEEDSDHPHATEVEDAATTTTPADMVDYRAILRQVDNVIGRMSVEKATAFRLSMRGYSALEIADVVFGRTSVSNADRKKRQDKVNTLVDRARREVVDKFHKEAMELNLLRQRRLFSR